MSLQVRFLRPGSPAGNWQVQSCSWAALGGPQAAELTLEQPGGTEWMQLAGLPGSPLELWDAVRGLPAWWGQVWGIEVQRGGRLESHTLEGLANRVAVSYWQTAPGQSGGRPALTDWAEDAISQGLYGLQARILSLAEASQERAEALRDAWLAARAQPQPLTGWRRPGMVERVRLTGRGWWPALEQRYLPLAAGREECLALGPGVQAVGAGSSSQKAAQSITPASSGWLAVGRYLLARTSLAALISN